MTMGSLATGAGMGVIDAVDAGGCAEPTESGEASAPEAMSGSMAAECSLQRRHARKTGASAGADLRLDLGGGGRARRAGRVGRTGQAELLFDRRERTPR